MSGQPWQRGEVRIDEDLADNQPIGGPEHATQLGQRRFWLGDLTEQVIR